jgi:hypothetical protein
VSGFPVTLTTRGAPVVSVLEGAPLAKATDSGVPVTLAASGTPLIIEDLPLGLFSAGQVGAWYDVQDLSTLFQDSAGTTAAEVDGPVGRMLDKSGNGNHMLQNTADSRPTLRQDGSRYYLEFDGTDDFLASTLTASLPQPWESVAAIRQITWTSNDRIFSGGTNTGDLYQFSATPGLALFDGGSAPVTPNNGLAVGADGIVSEHHDGASSTVKINNGSAVSVGAAIGTTTMTVMTIGRRHASGTLYGNFRFYGRVIRPAMTLTENSALRAWMAARTGIIL